MKVFTGPAAAMIESGEIHLNAAIRCSFGSTYRLWSGIGDLEVPGEGVFLGTDAKLLIMPVQSELGGGAGGAQVVLSGLEPAIAATIEDESYHQKPVVIWYLPFAHDRVTLLDAKVYLRARCDFVKVNEQPNGTSDLIFMLEGPGRDMSRAGGRVDSDADQRLLGGATDGAMKHASIAGSQTLYWGRKPAGAATSVNGGLTGGAGGRGLVPFILTSIN